MRASAEPAIRTKGAPAVSRVSPMAADTSVTTPSIGLLSATAPPALGQVTGLLGRDAYAAQDRAGPLLVGARLRHPHLGFRDLNRPHEPLGLERIELPHASGVRVELGAGGGVLARRRDDRRHANLRHGLTAPDVLSGADVQLHDLPLIGRVHETRSLPAAIKTDAGSSRNEAASGARNGTHLASTLVRGGVDGAGDVPAGPASSRCRRQQQPSGKPKSGNGSLHRRASADGPGSATSVASSHSFTRAHACSAWIRHRPAGRHDRRSIRLEHLEQCRAAVLEDTPAGLGGFAARGGEIVA